MLVDLPLLNMSMSNIFGIDVAFIISHIFYINFAKIHTNNEVVISMTLLFSRMLNLVKRFH